MRDDPFTHNDGRNTHLLRADGTIPIFYQGVKYNIPLKMFLPEGFPSQPPICYVQPTPNMIIKPGHTMVDGSGMVRAPYCDHWSHPRSSLSELAASLSEVREVPHLCHAVDQSRPSTCTVTFLSFLHDTRPL